MLEESHVLLSKGSFGSLEKKVVIFYSWSPVKILGQFLWAPANFWGRFPPFDLLRVTFVHSLSVPTAFSFTGANAAPEKEKAVGTDNAVVLKKNLCSVEKMCSKTQSMQMCSKTQSMQSP